MRPPVLSWARRLDSDARRRAGSLVAAGDLDDAVLEALGGRVRRALELVGDRGIGAAQERLGHAVELLAKPVRRLLADRAHPVLELVRPRLAQPVHLARRRPLQLLGLAALELRERDLDPGPDVALRPVHLLR